MEQNSFRKSGPRVIGKALGGIQIRNCCKTGKRGGHDKKKPLPIGEAGEGKQKKKPILVKIRKNKLKKIQIKTSL